MSVVADPTTTILFLTDSHAGAGTEGFQQQPRRPDLLPSIFEAIRQIVRQHKVDLIIHGGDLTEHGTLSEIEQARDLLRILRTPSAICLGNHDLASPQSIDMWRAMAERSDTFHLADSTVALPGADLVLLNTAWSAEPPHFFWDRNGGCNEGLLVEQLRWLDNELSRQDGDRPAMLFTHAPLDLVPPELTGAPEPIHLVKQSYAAALNGVLDRHPRVKLVFTGHNHVTCATRHGNRVHVSTSAVVEPPFEVRLVRIARTSLDVQTVAVMPMTPEILYDPKRSWVNGRPCDRTIRMQWT